MAPLPVSYAPGREWTAAINAGSIADGDTADALESGGGVLSAAVRCNQSFCCVREGGSVPGWREGGDPRGLLGV